MKTLAKLKQGEYGIVREMIGEDTSVRLLEMGLLPGRHVQLIRTAPFGNPLYLKVGTQYLSIRREEANHVLLQ